MTKSFTGFTCIAEFFIIIIFLMQGIKKKKLIDFFIYFNFFLYFNFSFNPLQCREIHEFIRICKNLKILFNTGIENMVLDLKTRLY